MRPAHRAQLALLLEVSTTPTPGCVDREHDHSDLEFAQFLAGAIGAGPGLLAAERGPLGPSFEAAVAGMADAQSAGNTQFGALLLLVPLVNAAATDSLTADGLGSIVADTDVSDTVAFLRAFDLVDVGIGEPPADLEALDVRDPGSAAATAQAASIPLDELMDRSADIDGIAREWSTGFERTLAAAARLEALEGPLVERATTVFIDLLADHPDTFVEKRHGSAVAGDVQAGARAVRDGEREAASLDEELLSAGINPGTTADLLAGSLFVALQRGVRA